MSDGFFKRGKVWWFRTDPLTGKQASSGKRDRKSAELEYTERSRRATNPDYQSAATEDTSLNHWAVKFVEHKRATKSAATVDFYTDKLGHVVRILGAATPINNALRPSNFDTYAIQRKEEGSRNTTIRKEIRAAQTMARLAARAGAYHGRPELLMPSDLVDDYEPGERFLTPEELPLLLPQLQPHRAAWVALEVAIGSRFAETARARAEDIDTESWLVRVRGSKTRRSKAVIPIAPPFRPLLVLALPYLPLQPWGNMVRDLAAACKRAGIKRVTANDLRRTHGSWLVEAGVNGTVGARVLRNTEVVFNRVYGRARPEQLVKLLEAQTSATITQQLPAPGDTSDGNSSEKPEEDMRIENPRVGGSIPSRDTAKNQLSQEVGDFAEHQDVAPGNAKARNVRNENATALNWSSHDGPEVTQGSRRGQGAAGDPGGSVGQRRALSRGADGGEPDDGGAGFGSAAGARSGAGAHLGSPAAEITGSDSRTRTQLTRREAEESGKFYAIGREDGPGFVAGVRLSDPVLDARRENENLNPRAITDSDVACAREADNSPGTPSLASEEPGVAGSSPARSGGLGTPGLTVGAIPAAGAINWLGPLPPPSEPGGFGWLRDEWGGR